MLEGQLLSFKPHDYALLIRTPTTVRELNIPLYQYVHIEFHPPKRCIGFYDGESWNACPHNAPGPQCEDCRRKDMKKLFTVLDTEGFEEIYERIKDKTYSVYLALYGEQVKVGVTRAERLEDRLREQGAMHYVEIFRIKGMDRAYEIESYLKQALGLKNHVSNKAKLNGEDNLEKLREAYERVKGLGVAPILPFDVKRNTFRLFPSAQLSQHIEGKVLGFRGNIVFFKNHHGVFYNIITYHIGERVRVVRYG